jgi:SAM-dependent methyltransferase
MAKKQSKQIVRELLSNPDLYKQKAKEEGEIWGEEITSLQNNKAINRDRKAAKELKFNRDKKGLIQLLKKHGIKPSFGLSLACGNGRAERNLISAGICSSFHGIDISEKVLIEAKELASKNNMNIKYDQGDLNDIALAKNSYDIVITQNCLHHILKLEHLANEVANSLKTNGVLWIHDYVGESQFQYSEERLEIVNAILAVLPKKLRYNNLLDCVRRKVVRPEPGTLVSPFESIRSADILPVFLERFEVIEKVEFNSILRLILPTGIKENYLENEDSRALFEVLFIMDRLLIEKEILKPTGGQYLLKKRN